jgi:hypothetical protein
VYTSRKGKECNIYPCLSTASRKGKVRNVIPACLQLAGKIKEFSVQLTGKVKSIIFTPACLQLAGKIKEYSVH